MTHTESLTIYVPETPSIMTAEARAMCSQILDKGHVSAVKVVPDEVYKQMIGKGPWPRGY